MACSSAAGAGASGGGSGFRAGPSLGSLPRLRKRRRVGRGREPLDEALVRFLSSQRAVEERFLALEECRLQREAEAEQRRAQMEQRRAEMERQHEFRMFSVFTHMVSALRPDLSPPPFSHRGRAREEEEEEGRGLYPRPSSDPPRASPYLSSRGNRIRDFETILQEGYTMYHSDKHDEDKNPSGIINLGTSENKLCFDLLSKRLSQTDMFQIDPPLLQYPDWKGHNFLREEIARFLTYYCKAPAPLKADNVLVVNGCGSLFSSLAAVLCDPEDGILIPTPFYGVITADVLLYSNVRLVHVPLDSQMSGSDERPFQLTVEKLEKGLEDAKQEGISVRVMILINPHNPLGEIYTPTEMKEFLEFAKRHELHAIVDEVYMLSVFDESATFHSVLSFNKIPDPQRTHVMWGISKDFAASGLRVGTLYSENKHVIDALGQMAYFHGVPGTTQQQVARLLHDRDWINQVYLQTNRARLKASRQYITSELNSLNIPYLDRPAGFYIWADFRKYLREETFEEEISLWRQFLNNKVLLSCGKAFECSKPGWFRIIFTDKTYRLQLVLEAERVFAVLAFILAGSCSCVCLLFILCWSSYTSRSSTSTSSQVNGGKVLFPGTLLLVILFPTGLFFLISWSLFTRHHRDEIAGDFAQLGSCYWLGALAWVLLLVAVPVTFVIEQFVCPDPPADTFALLEPGCPSQQRTGAGSVHRVV
ncbi:1-aminocyclopropane-1-carboxylate synthase-like protein 1 isoform X4 [Polyodon spathula]|uniref:1-aminocyclopropane-1-carboxylate synthase-like protein 1 isoform X4 n=2 Tax=Polyodon spathula TaxID=7913 RepID=UPI001B7E13C0|nr:1-aminocyclopropane-1-carboxylate synthase-like protein 1 isoform X4 [Polyodon spathula]XP_041131373.1 1-aminocyclopropane-1-carboxylate synthase-like protein 1 isoform X4 [Polyodon spathula]